MICQWNNSSNFNYHESNYHGMSQTPTTTDVIPTSDPTSDSLSLELQFPSEEAYQKFLAEGGPEGLTAIVQEFFPDLLIPNPIITREN
jgi:hypothetical protein